MCGQQDHGQRGVAGTHFVKQGQAVAPGQAHIAEHQLRARNVQLRQRRFGRAHGHHVVPGGFQAQRQQPQHVGVVVHHQDAGGWGGTVGGRGVHGGGDGQGAGRGAEPLPTAGAD